MDNSVVQLVGSPCGQHGPYTFYKAFKYIKNGLKRMVKLSDFFFVKLWNDSDLVCIGELQLLWIDKNSEQVLSSLRLYFLPENTPEGRMDHGEDEVLAISEKVVLRLDDLITWITVDAEWTWGRVAKWEAEVRTTKNNAIINTDITVTLSDGSMDFADIDKEHILDYEKCNKGASVIILSYPSYCRYRAMMKRIEGVEEQHLKNTIVQILGGFTAPNRNMRVLFCRDTFDYPELEGHELLCNHLAPKLKGRPRGKRKKRSSSPGSESNESESSVCNMLNTTKTKLMTEGPNGFRSDAGISPRRSTRSAVGNTENKEFIKKLNAFMKSNRTPMGRIPSLGYRELDLHAFFSKVDKLGGYDAVTTNRLWKSIFDDLSGNYISTSAATVIRRHYERFLLPYERHLKGEEYKLSLSPKRSKSHSGSGSDAETSESTSRSGNSSPVPSRLTPVSLVLPPFAADSKESFETEKLDRTKTSSLRSVRVKPERLREQVPKERSVGDPESNSTKNEPFSPLRHTNESHLTNSSLMVELISTATPTIAQKPSPNDIAESSPIKSTICTTEKVSRSLSSPTLLSRTTIMDEEEKEKENIATCNAINNNNDYGSVGVDLAEVPYKPKSPEIVNYSETEEASSNSVISKTALLHSVKKRKLDILKEGGLEVTPVTPTPIHIEPKEENRPTVIHRPTATVGQLSITLAPEKQTTEKTSVDCKSELPSFSTVQNLKPTSQFFLHLNGQSPPKVVQSKSIYSYSERTVYGNPKDYFMPPPRAPPLAPKFAEAPARQRGGEILDLTLKSPQKPMVEIMRVPTVASHSPSAKDISSSCRKSANLPVLDARVGSNLEITLVGPPPSRSIQQKPAPSRSRYNSIGTMHSTPANRGHNTNHKTPLKRTLSGSFVASRREENGILPYSITPVQRQTYPAREHRPSPHANNPSDSHRNSMPKAEHRSSSTSQCVKPYATAPSTVLPAYFSHLQMAHKMMPSYIPPMDPLYYSALQSLYPQNRLSQVPPFFPVPTPEQLQFYTDLMTHNSQMRFPFACPQDGGAASVAANTENAKFKKQ